jgi:hypothetical protein
LAGQPVLRAPRQGLSAAALRRRTEEPSTMKTCTGIVLALAALHVTAAAPADNTSTALPDPRLGYRSAFDTPLLSNAPAADWRDSNEQMRRLGGHAGHLRGMPRNETAAPPKGGDARPVPQSAGAAATAAPWTTATPAASGPAPSPASGSVSAPPAHHHHGVRP